MNKNIIVPWMANGKPKSRLRDTGKRPAIPNQYPLMGKP
jgi:hypothetical protein